MQTEPPSSAQESKPDDEPNMESPSPKHPNPLLSQTKMEPLSPKEEVKPKLELSEVENVEVKTKLLRKEIAFLRCLLQGSPLQGNYWRVIALCSSVTRPVYIAQVFMGFHSLLSRSTDSRRAIISEE